MSEARAIQRGPGLGALNAMQSGADDQFQIDMAFHLSRAWQSLLRPVALRYRRARALAFGARTHRLMRAAQKLNDADLQSLLVKCAASIDASKPFSPAQAQALAWVAVVAERRLGLIPFKVQLAGAVALMAGEVIEMETGSGKTLTAALATGVAALGGENVHVVTANDYLAERDFEWLQPFYKALGLTSGLIAASVPQETRLSAYRAAIVHASNKELAFDYLRNRIHLGADAGPVRLTMETLVSVSPRAASISMRGLPFVIVDEADSVLIDECRTPLIISANEPPNPDWVSAAMMLADALDEGRDFAVDAETRRIVITDEGRKRLAVKGDDMEGIWRNGTRREHAARQMLSARHLFERDEHYALQDGKIALIDEYTGRLVPDRSLGDGLQQAVEGKEGVEITGRRRTTGRITYQRFFRRYARSAGMTGTAREVAGEIRAIYGLDVTPIPPPKRSRRRRWRTRVCRNEDAKWATTVTEARRIAKKGRAVLIATRTIRASLAVSEALATAGLDHEVLNATQDADEGAVIAMAGQPGRITVATNMAGRGVDIVLHDDVRRAGGLHVIVTECHEAGRIDRQAAGRAARQGDPGSFRLILSWTDALVETFGGVRARLRLGHETTFERAQRRAEKLHAQARIDLLRHDHTRNAQLKFTGSNE